MREIQNLYILFFGTQIGICATENMNTFVVDSGFDEVVWKSGDQLKNTMGLETIANVFMIKIKTSVTH